MATYKYQQNFYEGSSAGYVKYNISPDFGTPVSIGDTITISGQFYNRDSKVYGIAFEAYLPGGFVTLFTLPIVAEKRKVTSFTYTYIADENLIRQSAATRNYSANPYFLLYEDSGLTSGTSTMTVNEQVISCLKYRLEPQIGAITFEDATGAYSHFGGAVQNKSNFTFTIPYTTDPFDSTVSISDVSMTIDDVNIPVFNITIANNNITFKIDPPKSTGVSVWKVRITDSKGLSSEVVIGSITVYPYTPPTINMLSGYDILERYTVNVDDQGNPSTAIADDGQYVWTTLSAIIAPINNANGWVLEVKWIAEGESELTATTIQIANAIDGSTYEITQSQNAIPQIYTFNAATRYNFTFTLTDFFESTQQVFTLDKAGGYMNVEKHGVGIGMRTTGKMLNEKFESAWPAYFYAGIHGVTNYSANEIATGGRWIDGRPIYRKVLSVECPNINTSYYSSDSVQNVDTVIGLNIITMATNRSSGLNLIIESGRYYSSSNYVRTNLEQLPNNSNNYRIFWWSNAVIGTAYAIVEYTKKNDEITYLLDAEGNVLIDANGDSFIVQ